MSYTHLKPAVFVKFHSVIIQVLKKHSKRVCLEQGDKIIVLHSVSSYIVIAALFCCLSQLEVVSTVSWLNIILLSPPLLIYAKVTLQVTSRRRSCSTDH